MTFVQKQFFCYFSMSSVFSSKKMDFSSEFTPHWTAPESSLLNKRSSLFPIIFIHHVWINIWTILKIVNNVFLRVGEGGFLLPVDISRSMDLGWLMKSQARWLWEEEVRRRPTLWSQQLSLGWNSMIPLWRYFWQANAKADKDRICS